MLKRVLGPREDKVTGEWRKLQKKEFKELYCSPNITQVITFRMGCMGHVSQIEVRRSVERVLVGIPEGKKPLGRSRSGIILVGFPL